jgi:hypothetical protein
MTGYGSIRDAVAHTIEEIGCEPVLAERFPAGTVSPRTACLDAVASCEGIVLILGARYGEETAAGMSATEEEYREAVRLKKHIFVFLERVEREPRQQEFIGEVEDYVDGHWRKSFGDSKGLAGLVGEALREAQPGIRSVWWTS